MKILVLAILIALAMASSASAGTVPVCLTIPAANKAAHKILYLPKSKDIKTLHNGHNLDPEERGITVYNRWILIALLEDVRSGEKLYLTLFRRDSHRGHLCIEVTY